MRTVATGEALLAPTITRRLIERFVSAPPLTQARPRERLISVPARPRSAADSLTPREREVLPLLATGGTNREIGKHLGVPERTARTHVSNILAKLGLASRTQAARGP